ncbi:hypothetical protein BLA29_015536 [Euroglyphus maynei]|uniref:Uncharacterized protein n=1 Tax=Euroglyphus maynei TaxID=6958 RepID=A0A1Y3B6Z5_EURMA|nr:hypothetical protein BLA29_015536 [Euroglyphus maynei]
MVSRSICEGRSGERNRSAASSPERSSALSRPAVSTIT